MAFNCNIWTSSFSFWSAITRRKHDVFLSFRGEDTRHNVTRRLHKALVEAGIPTFKDDIDLEKGCEISSDLLKAIQSSTIAIIIFSRNYANSRWCLDELVKIIECKNEDGQVVLPIFYDVDPCDVMHQKGSFEKALKEQELRFGTSEKKLGRWREALTEAASQSEWDGASWDPSNYIDEIVRQVTSRRQDAHMSVSMFPPKTDDAKEYLNLLLSVISNDVLIIGICGMDKTSTATAVFNQNYWRFEASSFLKDVNEIAKQPNGLLALQKRLLSEILEIDDLEIDDVKKGTDMIEKEISSRRVLVVLDNVNKLDQLNVLARKRKWFGPGSRIIITTRDQQLLNVLEVDYVCGAQGIQAVIEDKCRENLQMIEGLVDVLRKSHVEAEKRVESLIVEIERERGKNTIPKQITVNSRQSPNQRFPLDALTFTTDVDTTGYAELQNELEFDNVYEAHGIQAIKNHFSQNRQMIKGLSELMRSPDSETVRSLVCEIEREQRKNNNQANQSSPFNALISTKAVIMNSREAQGCEGGGGDGAMPEFGPQKEIVGGEVFVGDMASSRSRSIDEGVKMAKGTHSPVSGRLAFDEAATHLTKTKELVVVVDNSGDRRGIGDINAKGNEPKPKGINPTQTENPP